MSGELKQTEKKRGNQRPNELPSKAVSGEFKQTNKQREPETKRAAFKSRVRKVETDKQTEGTRYQTSCLQKLCPESSNRQKKKQREPETKQAAFKSFVRRWLGGWPFLRGGRVRQLNFAGWRLAVRSFRAEASKAKGKREDHTGCGKALSYCTLAP